MSNDGSQKGAGKVHILAERSRVFRERRRIDRRRQDREIKKYHRKIAVILESITDAFFILDKQWRFTYLNKEAEHLWLRNRKELVGKVIWEEFPNEVNTKFYKECQKALTQRSAVHFELFSRIIRKWFEVHAYPSREGLSIYFRDISKRKKAEEELKAERRRLLFLLDGLPALVCLQAPDHTLRFANRNFIERFGRPGKRHCYELQYGCTEPCEGCKVNEVFSDNEPRNWERSAQNVSFQFYCYPFSDIDGSPLVLKLGIDITEQKRLEKEMARLDRLNLIGEMAAGIGHEIRNPMTTVRGFLQMLGEKQDCARYREYYNLMIDELDRANSIITEFLSLAKNKAIDLKVQNLNKIIKAISPLIVADAMVYDKYVKMELGDVPDLLLDKKEIRQLTLNLVRNGLEAMSPGQYLTIKTFAEEGEVVLAVQDQGKGIEPDLLDKIGTPFLTTKEQGTGLGLAVCYSIAARHNASIDFETGPTGCTFYVRFKT